MCGLVSIIARNMAGFYAQDLDLFEQLLILDQFRGKDSAGAMTTFKDGNQFIIKHATRHVTLMFDTKDWKNFRGRAITGGRFLTGHNRAATRGKATTENAHPFVEGRISLCHNGTIYNQGTLAPGAKIDVDSNAIAIALDEDPIETVIPKINGAFALIWYNNEDEKLYAIRNEERPLHLITTANFYFLMSEPWMMMAGWNRQNGRGKIDEVRELIPGELLSFDLTGKLESREVSLAEKKPQGPSTGRGTSATADTYASWAARQQAEKYNNHGRSHSAATKGAVEDSMEDGLPFAAGVTEPPLQTKELQHIRSILSESAKRKSEREARETPSTNCVLMLPSASRELTPPTKNASNENLTGGGRPNDVDIYVERQEATQRNIIIENKEFKKGDFTLVKIWSTTQQGKFTRWTGKIIMPGKPILDATGVMPDGMSQMDVAEWAKIPLTGNVRFVTYTSGGPSVFVERLVRAGTCDVYGDDIPWVLWNKALVEGCSTCAGKLFDWERPFTSVRAKGVTSTEGMRNGLRNTCPDCLMKSLPDGEIYDTYTKRYYDAKSVHDRRCAAEGRSSPNRNSSVQNRKQLGEKPVSPLGGTIIVPGSPTIQ